MPFSRNFLNNHKTKYSLHIVSLKTRKKSNKRNWVINTAYHMSSHNQTASEMTLLIPEGMDLLLLNEESLQLGDGDILACGHLWQIWESFIIFSFYDIHEF